MWTVCALKSDRTQPKCKRTGYYPQKAVPIAHLGQHQHRDDALRALVTEYYPEHKNASVPHLKLLAKDLLTGSLKIHKLVNIK